ncbi:MAG: hypothetical protein BWX90_00001 [bacterium ADurb.Bin132]|nr:MAG: hypothetical protein BWX90_00001 [bacterium ADurb.Bin132]
MKGIVNLMYSKKEDDNDDMKYCIWPFCEKDCESCECETKCDNCERCQCQRCDLSWS